MSARALTRWELDPMTCGTPGCNCGEGLMINGQCHPGAPLFVQYDNKMGVLAITCAPV